MLGGSSVLYRCGILSLVHVTQYLDLVCYTINYTPFRISVYNLSFSRFEYYYLLNKVSLKQSAIFQSFNIGRRQTDQVGLSVTLEGRGGGGGGGVHERLYMNILNMHDTLDPRHTLTKYFPQKS